MFQSAKPIWIKDKSNEMNVFAAFCCRKVLDQDGELHITGASFYRVYVNDIFLGFGPARTAYGYAREDVLRIKLQDLAENAGVSLEEKTEIPCEIVIEACGYYCKGLSTVQQPSFLMAELVVNGEVLSYSGRDFEGFLPTCKLQKVERYSRQRHFTEIWDFRKHTSMVSDTYKAETEILSLDLKLLERVAPYPSYKDVAVTSSVLGGVYEFDAELPYKKEKYSRVFLPEGWGFWPYDEIELHPHTWIQRQRQTVTYRRAEFPLEIQKGQYAILDFERIEAGFFKAQLKALRESEVVIAFTEFYQGDIFELPNMNAHNVIDIFLAKDDDREFMSFEPYSSRFVMIAVKEGAVKLKSFGIKTFMFNIDKVIYPEYQDDTLNAIYRAAVRTFAHNAVDLYVDCPSRERAGWLCDSYFTAKTEYALTGETRVEDAFLENYALYRNRGEIHEGAIPMCYPADIETDDPEGRFIPQWTMWYILECAEYILKRGHLDKAFDFKHNIYMLLNFYRQYENEDGLLERLPSWHFVEWSKANDWTEDVNYPTNFLYAQVLESVADIYGDEKCRVKSAKVRETAIEQSFNGRYFMDHAVRDEAGKLVLQDDSSEAAQYYAVLFGCIDIKDSRFKELKALITDVFAPDREGRMPEIMEVNAFIGAYLRLEALLKMEQYELLLRDVKGFFGNMEQYTGTLWEYRQFKGSCDHGFASYALVAIREAMEHLSKYK